MGIPVARSNVFQNKKRMLAATAGIAFSILLVFMQLGFLRGARAAAIVLFECFDYDLALVSDKYQYVGSTGLFDRIRLSQARAVTVVDSTMSLKLARGDWEDPDTKMVCQILLIGMGLDPQFVKNPVVLSGLNTLENNCSIMLDLYSHKDYGDISLGRVVKINKVHATIASYFKLGVSLFSEGCCLISEESFSSFTKSNPRMVNYGFIRLKPGTDREEARRSIEAALPSDIRVLERSRMLRQEQDYFTAVKPVGIIFLVGVFTAFLVGVVILFQVLATDITKRLNEFATLKAMGFGVWFIYGIGVKQGMIYAFSSFPVSALLAFCIFRMVHYLSRMPMDFSPSLVLFVFSMTLLMCVISSGLALQKIRKTDPAELY
ncbi:MAG: ABC transporter permease [Desulfobacteraceae bacterium]|nr:ABC transporter permease [Desulfobacteraceae bacterium]